jgi:tRNA-2-methylthio-N6-dimethylallyladenosine synthase
MPVRPITPLPQLSSQAAHFQAVPLAQRANHRQPLVPALGRPPRVHLWHIGCQMNEADRVRLGEQMAEIGCVPEVALDDADLVVMITCTVRDNAERKAYGKFRELVPWKRARPGRAIALTGCMGVEHGSALLDRMKELDYVFDVREPEGFLSKLQALYTDSIEGSVPMPASDRLSAYVPVIGGCNEMCTYCIVPFVRGRETSRPVEDVVGDVRRLVERGVREVTLLGQNVNSYREPGGEGSLPELMAAVDAVDGLWRMRFLTSHPRNASPALFDAIRELPTACEQLHLPVQAGDDELLRRMRRVYTVDEYKAVIQRARDAVPGLGVTTDIIVGFCGETETEFLGTEQLLRDVRYDTVHIQAYSPRPGTAAARRADDVPAEEKMRRLQHLLELQKGIALERNRELIGTNVEVLVEGVAGDGRPYGRTRQNRLAYLPAGSALAGERREAVVREVAAWQLEVEPLLVSAA